MSNSENKSDNSSTKPIDYASLLDDLIVDQNVLNENNTDPFASSDDDNLLTGIQNLQESAANALSKHTNAAKQDELVLTSNWDPMNSFDWDKEKPSVTCLNRIKKDVSCIYENQSVHEGICLLPMENDITRLHAIIIGPEKTPYEGGFFHFIIRCPPNYPNQSPRVKLLTTGSGRVRFNPNLYSNGKVCLSILNTWYGPRWSPAQGLDTLLISMQSLLNEKPYCNEPGYEASKDEKPINEYNDAVRYYTLRYAVCEMMENIVKLPDYLADYVKKYFMLNKDKYLKFLQDNMSLHDTRISDRFNSETSASKFDYNNVKTRLDALFKVYKESEEETKTSKIYSKYLNQMCVETTTASNKMLSNSKEYFSGNDYLDYADLGNDDYDDFDAGDDDEDVGDVDMEENNEDNDDNNNINDKNMCLLNNNDGMDLDTVSKKVN